MPLSTMKRAYVLLLVLVVITNLVVPSWGFFFHSSSSIAPPSSSLPSRKNDAEKMKTSSSVPSLLPAFQLFFALITPVASMSEPASAATPPKGIDFTTISKLQDEAFQATNRFDWKKAEVAWTKVLDADDTNAAAFSNRGNTRTSMGLCVEAIEDFNKAVELAPQEPDPYLGRGVAEECLKNFEAAIQDYETANKKNIAMTGVEDPVTYNNRANAEAGLGRWEEALKDYRLAAKMQPGYVFPLASAALTTYQLGQDAEAIKQMRLLLIKYPELVDTRAALAAIYWKQGEFAKAESAWYEVINADPRYRRREWVQNIRRWPPRMVKDLENFLDLKLPSPSPATAATDLQKIK